MPKDPAVQNPDEDAEEREILRQGARYLVSSGWTTSRKFHRPIDRDLQPLPWYTYSAIAFIGSKVTQDMRVFEYGSGYSTLWWASRVSQVVTVEHSRRWAKGIGRRIPDNVDLQRIPLVIDGDYCRAARVHVDDPFHVMVIDGRDRVNCLIQGLAALRDDGVIIWDNSDRTHVAEGFEILAENGFKKIGFYGHGPVNPSSWETGVFYRPDNCFGI